MCYNNTMALAKQNLAERVGVTIQHLDFAFRWEYNCDIYYSFQINLPGHAYFGSTLSVKIDDAYKIHED